MPQSRRRRSAVGAFVGILLIPSLASAQADIARAKAERPAPSPDGSRIVYVSDVAGNRDLWSTDAAGSNPAVLLNWLSDETDPSWSPDGQHIVFSSSHDAAKHHIWRVDANGLNPLKLTDDDAEHERPRYSPDGSRILYVSNATGKKELWLMNADGSSARSLALISTRVSDPAWSPNGQAIVYVGCRRGAACNLFRINADASGGRQITNGEFQDWNPDWGSQGILFASNRGGTQGLWLVQPDGSGLTQITAPDGSADLDPRWTTASSFVFSRSGQNAGDAASDIWSSTSTATPPQRVTRTIIDTTPPVVLPVIAGSAGSAGWYVSAVTINWQVSDPESGIASSSGCNPLTLTGDTPGTTVTCTAQNGVGLSTSLPLTVKIDQTPPAILGMPSSGCSLWPPDHQFVQVATVTVSDGGSGLASFDLVGTSNQPQSADGPDVLIKSSGGSGLDPKSVELRAERLGEDRAGRIYNLLATATDAAGNKTTANAVCVVPHDQR